MKKIIIININELNFKETNKLNDDNLEEKDTSENLIIKSKKEKKKV